MAQNENDAEKQDMAQQVGELTSSALETLPAFGALANTESARAIAQVQASMLLARAYPRDEEMAVVKIEEACSRYSLAQKATYVYSRGGEEIHGPTIRLAEAISQAWGNMRSGVREVSRDYENGVSKCCAFAVDQQTGNEDEREFFVRHWRDVRGNKGYRVTTDRDIRELVANYGARAKRACIEAVVPKYVFEDALEACEQTLLREIRTDEDALKSMLHSFAELGVEQVHIEERINRALVDILPAQMIHLHKIYNSLKGGDSMPSQWFSIVDPEAVESSPNTIENIVARGSRRTAAKAPAAKAGDEKHPIAVAIVQAQTTEALNAATVRIGPLSDLALKERLYNLADEQSERIKAQTK